MSEKSTTSWRENLKDPKRWVRQITRTVLWMAGAWLFFVVLGRVVPGEVIFVISNSIPRGIYWQDSRPFDLQRHQYITLRFAPSQPWIAERYARDVDSPRHTKTIGAVAGDVIVADAEQNYFACVPLIDGNVSEIPVESAVTKAGMQCSAIGRPQKVDSNFRPMVGWLAAGTEYTLAPGEVWIYGPNERSLDSRYYGPLPVSQVVAKATPLLQID